MADTPIRLATCSYRKFGADMGLPVRISRPPRDVVLPDLRFYSNRRIWIQLKEAIPAKGTGKLPHEDFAEAYLANLDRFGRQVENKLGWLYRYHGMTVVLLCTERRVSGPADCHRRLFAEWWEHRTGIHVPELDGR